MKKQQKQRILTLLRLCADEYVRLTGGGEVGVCLNNIEQALRQVLLTAAEDYVSQKTTKCLEIMRKIRAGKVKPPVLFLLLEQLRIKVYREKETGKIEVVFFPYKFAMSDSLKSIYMTAKADPDCEAYWCPIPYFNRDETGALSEMLYEGDRYGEEFEVTDWQEFGLEHRRPDIIFTHYAYDGCNRVTTIHPDFYSDKLKKHTDLLVYVDYGLTWWLWENPPEKLSEQEPCTPAYWNADVVITHTREYIKTLAWHMKSWWCHNVDGKVPELPQDKFAALGSPKFDVVIRDSRERHVLPERWQEIIGGKKVLLYNTSLFGLLRDYETFLKDVVEVIEQMSRCEGIVLWWRPHPLMDATLQSMLPALLKTYREIVELFKESGLGIYDNTPDLHRAIAWSDGCLTYESSLIWLYLATGKPFTICNHKKLLTGSYVSENGRDFRAILQYRMENMRAGKGANPYRGQPGWNWCVWWDNFLPEDQLHKVHYNRFLERFAHYIVHVDEYEEAEEYRHLQLQILQDFIVNPDGTAGEKIYNYCKERIRG